jgi:hypothetical protein
VRPKIPMPTQPWHGPMRTREITPSASLLYPDSEAETADVLEATYHETRPLINDLWGLAPPATLTLHVLTTPARHLLLGLKLASWPNRLLQLALWPVVYWGRVGRWRYAAGFCTPHMERPIASIKPPCLLDETDAPIGRHLYVEGKDVRAKLRHIACHEITHAFAARPRMPRWLTEGVAEWTVEKYLGRQVVRTDTLDLLRVFGTSKKRCKYKDLSAAETQFLYPYVRGYWAVRYIEETHPGFLKTLFCSEEAATLSPRQVEKAVARQLGMTLKELRRELDAVVLKYFDTQTLCDDDASLPT